MPKLEDNAIVIDSHGIRRYNRGKWYELSWTNYASSEDDYEEPGQIGDYETGQYSCLLYTSPSPRDRISSRMPSSA